MLYLALWTVTPCFNAEDTSNLEFSKLFLEEHARTALKTVAISYALSIIYHTNRIQMASSEQASLIVCGVAMFSYATLTTS